MRFRLFAALTALCVAGFVSLVPARPVSAAVEDYVVTRGRFRGVQLKASGATRAKRLRVSKGRNRSTGASGRITRQPGASTGTFTGTVSRTRLRGQRVRRVAELPQRTTTLISAVTLILGAVLAIFAPNRDARDELVQGGQLLLAALSSQSGISDVSARDQVDDQITAAKEKVDQAIAYIDTLPARPSSEQIATLVGLIEDALESAQAPLESLIEE